jgi:hypothetical protein
MYQRKIAYGSAGFPWVPGICERDVDYRKGICPVAEQLHEKSYLGFEMCQLQLPDADVERIVAAFRKVWSSLSQLAEVS